MLVGVGVLVGDGGCWWVMVVASMIIKGSASKL